MIDAFKNEYFFLSNFYNTSLTYEGITYHNSEAAFQAAKTLDVSDRERISRMSPTDAKKAGRSLRLRSDWEDIKDKVMHDVCRAKFIMNDELRKRLLATNDEDLVEGNTWHDNYWATASVISAKIFSGGISLAKR